MLQSFRKFLGSTFLLPFEGMNALRCLHHKPIEFCPVVRSVNIPQHLRRMAIEWQEVEINEIRHCALEFNDVINHSIGPKRSTMLHGGVRFLYRSKG